MLTAIISIPVADHMLQTASTTLTMRPMLNLVVGPRTRACSHAATSLTASGGSKPCKAPICRAAMPGSATRPYSETTAVNVGKREKNVWKAIPAARIERLSLLISRHVATRIAHQNAIGPHDLKANALPRLDRAR
jgi:hypothetical protein